MLPKYHQILIGLSMIVSLSGCALVHQLENGPPKQDDDTEVEVAAPNAPAQPMAVKSSPSDEEQAAAGIIYSDAKGLRQCFIENPKSWKKQAQDNAVWLKVKISPLGKALSFQDGPSIDADPVLRQCLGKRLQVLEFPKAGMEITAQVNFRFDK